MKKIMRLTGLLSLMFAAFFAMSSFIVTESSSSSSDLNADRAEKTYSCTVTVYKRAKNGQTWPYEYATVAGNVKGLTGGMTKDVKTDSKGKAVIEWYSDADLGAIYVGGKKFPGTYVNGGSYTIYVDA